MRTFVSTAAAAAVTVGLAVGATGAQAATLQPATLQQLTFTKDSSGDFFDLQGNQSNDCSGYFGQGFLNCTIGIEGIEGAEDLSPVIAKYEKGGGGTVQYSGDADPNINKPEYPTVSGTEFNINEGAGSWTYEQGVGDPNILYWVLKQSNMFTLHWWADNDKVGDGACNVVASLSCLLAAVPIIGGSWTTDFSHITWYDSGGATTVIPLPAGLLLFLSGLVGIGVLGRYKAKRRELATI